MTCRNDPKFSDRYAWANSADPDQTAPREPSDLGLCCLPFHLHRLDSLPYGRTSSLRKCLRIRSVISVNYHYITVYVHLTY